MTLVGRTHHRAATTIALVAAVAIAALGAALVARNSNAVGLIEIGGFDGGLRWNSSALAPADLQRAAAHQLLDWLGAVAGAVAGVGAIAIFTLWAQQAALRGPEIAVHRAVGASRRALITGSLGEGIAIATAATALGLGVALAVGSKAGAPLGAVLSLWPAVVAVGAPLLVGALFPLWAARARQVAEPARTEPPLGIAAVQIGASMVVLVAGTMLVQQADRQLLTGPGGLDAGTTVTTVAMVDPDAPARAVTLSSLMKESKDADSNRLVSITSPGGHLGLGTIDNLTTDCGQCFVGGIFLKWRNLQATYQAASADTFEARKSPVVEGRNFSGDDRVGAPAVAIVNVYLARRYFENGQAVGRLLYPMGRLSGTGYRVVGVVDDARPSGFGGGNAPLETVYLSALQHPPAIAEIATVGRGPAPSPTFGVIRRESASEMLGHSTAIVRWFGRWFLAEGAAVLTLALVGTIALMLLWVSALRDEFAVRRAVGARAIQIVLLVVGRTLWTGVRGVAIGLAFFAPTIWPELSKMIPGLSYWQPALVGQYSLLLVGVALIAALIPAVRASQATPASLWSAR